MKQCPNCHQAFAYKLLKFCRFDGSRLVSGPPEEATTRLLPPVQLSGEHVQGEASAEPSARIAKTPPGRQMTSL